MLGLPPQIVFLALIISAALAIIASLMPHVLTEEADEDVEPPDNMLGD